MQIHQLHTSAGYGDAIGNEMSSIREILRRQGHLSEIFAEHIDPRLAEAPHHYLEYRVFSDPENLLLLHFSVAYPPHLWEFVSAFPDRKVLIYHNITPRVFFHGVNELYYQATKEGRRQLGEFASRVELGLGDSEYNRQELCAAGFRRTGVLPLAFDERQHGDAAPDPHLINWLEADDWANLLFVGRIAPNKRFEDLISTFSYLKAHLRPRSRLLLVGSSAGTKEYERLLRRFVDRLDLNDVHFCGHVPSASLMAYYRCADVFLCMSEHEGFCVPLLESMHFGVPIVAYQTPGVMETLGEAGITLGTKDYAVAAEVLDLVIRDWGLRESVVAKQRERLAHFAPQSVEKRLLRYVDSLLGRLKV